MSDYIWDDITVNYGEKTSDMSVEPIITSREKARMFAAEMMDLLGIREPTTKEKLALKERDIDFARNELSYLTRSQLKTAAAIEEEVTRSIALATNRLHQLQIEAKTAPPVFGPQYRSAIKEQREKIDKLKLEKANMIVTAVKPIKEMAERKRDKLELMYMEREALKDEIALENMEFERADNMGAWIPLNLKESKDEMQMRVDIKKDLADAMKEYGEHKSKTSSEIGIDEDR